MSLRLNLCIASLFVCVLSFGAQRAHAQSVTLVSRMGAKCLDAEGGRSVRGTRLIGYPCNGQANEQFQFNANGTITQRGLCVDVTGGLGHDGDQIELWDCNGGANQKWKMVNGQLSGTMAFMKGQMKIAGDVLLAQKMQQIFPPEKG